MLSIESAKKIGIDRCIDALGRDFCIRHQSNALSGFEEPHNNILRCFVTIDDEEIQEAHYVGGEPMKYKAIVDVDIETGETTLIEIHKGT